MTNENQPETANTVERKTIDNDNNMPVGQTLHIEQMDDTSLEMSAMIIEKETPDKIVVLPIATFQGTEAGVRCLGAARGALDDGKAFSYISLDFSPSAAIVLGSADVLTPEEVMHHLGENSDGGAGNAAIEALDAIVKKASKK